MFQIGQPVVGTFVCAVRDWSRTPGPTLSHITGAFFDVGDEEWAKLPMDHACDGGSDRLTQRRLEQFTIGESVVLEIIGTPNDKYPYVTVGEKVVEARKLLAQPRKLWTVKVIQHYSVVNQSVHVLFPNGYMSYAHADWLGLRRDELIALRYGSTMIVKLDSIHVDDGKRLLRMHAVDPQDLPDHQIAA